MSVNNNKDIQKYKDHELVSKLKLTDQEFEANFFAIKKMVDDENACEQIPNKCINSTNVHLHLVRDANNKLVIKPVYCAKMLMLNKALAYRKNFVYSSFNDDFFRISILKKYFPNPSPSKTKLLKEFIKIIKNPNIKYGLYIHGPVGVGKTYSCIAFANDLARIGKHIAFCFIPDFVFNLKMGFDNPEISKKNLEIINKLKTVDFLFLDDIGAEKSSGWFYSEYLMIILNARMQTHKPTFFTSNMSIDILEKKLSGACGPQSAKRLAERIRGTTNNRSIEVVGENLRYPKR